jgi:hypothetical protein
LFCKFFVILYVLYELIRICYSPTTNNPIRVKFTDNKYLGSAETGQGIACAVRNISSGEWVEEPSETDLDGKNVIVVCLTACKECAFDPVHMKCLKGEPIIIVQTFGAKFTALKPAA